MRTLTVTALALALAGLPGSATADGALYRDAVDYRATLLGVSPTAEAIATGDFTGDGVVDVVVTEETAGGVVVLPGAGDGTLAPRLPLVRTGAGADAVSAGDLDGDGTLDLVVANGIAGTVSVLYGDSAGGLAEGAQLNVGSAPGAVAIRDFDGNGIVDFAVAANPSYLFLGQGGRQFTGRNLGVGSSVVGLGAGDVDGDGRLDIVVGDGFPARLQVLHGAGDGTFAAPQVHQVPGWVQEAFRVGDVTGDGLDDVVSVTSEGKGSVFLGTPGGALAAPRGFASGMGSDGLEIADLDGDGRADLAVNEAGSSKLAIHLGDGNGGFTEVESHGVIRSAESVAVVDLDGDGLPDLVAAPFVGPNISVLLHA